jgi:hypothetical protein
VVLVGMVAQWRKMAQAAGQPMHELKALEADLKSATDVENLLIIEQQQTEERAQAAEAQLNAASYRIQQLIDQIRQRGQVTVPPSGGLTKVARLPRGWRWGLGYSLLERSRPQPRHQTVQTSVQQPRKVCGCPAAAGVPIGKLPERNLAMRCVQPRRNPLV